MIVFTLLVSLAFGCALGHECLQDWIYYECSCYGFGETAVTWADAQAICQLHGANLAKIETEEEHNFLAALSRNQRASFVWVGANDIFSEGYWVWTNGHESMTNFTNWGPNEPNNGGNDEDCLNLYKEKDYKWNDSPCKSTANFVCETRLFI